MARKHSLTQSEVAIVRERLAQIIKNYGSQRVAAENIGITQQSYSRILGGARCGYDIARRVAEHERVPTDELLRSALPQIRLLPQVAPVEQAPPVEPDWKAKYEALREEYQRTAVQLATMLHAEKLAQSLRESITKSFLTEEQLLGKISEINRDA